MLVVGKAGSGGRVDERLRDARGVDETGGEAGKELAGAQRGQAELRRLRAAERPQLVVELRREEHDAEPDGRDVRDPSAAAGPWVSGDGSENSIAAPGGVKRRAIMAGHMSALTFAASITKLETVRNPNDFGDFIRGLNVYGFKAVAPKGLALLVAA